MVVVQETPETAKPARFSFYVKKRKLRRNSSMSVISTAESINTIASSKDNLTETDLNPGSAGSHDKSMNGSMQSVRSARTDEIVDNEVDGDNINVVIRVRPRTPKEEQKEPGNGDNMLQFPGQGQIWIDENKSDKLKPYTFNVVFEPEATQEDVIEHSGMKRLIEMGIDGFSTTVFCYGQTGSGKTHTLTGPPYLEKILTNSSGKVLSTDGSVGIENKDHGLVFRSFIYLFEQLQLRQDDATFVIKASYLEIYNEKVIDLLNPGSKRSNLEVRWNKRTRSFVVDNLFSIECAELDDLVAVLEEGLKNRAIGTHNMNEHSSRSHTILTVHIHSEEKADSEDNKGVFITRHGKINFVDLAGSEMTKKTKSEGKTLMEANNINKSLMVLGYCISQLSTQKRPGKGHIPYRDSKLTKLLADSLAGNGVTLMIACVSPIKSNFSETSNTLRYAARAKMIKTKPVIVMDPREALIVSLKRHLATLKQENNHLRQLVNLADVSGNYQDDQEPNLANGINIAEERATPLSNKLIDKSRLSQLDSGTLLELIKDYMTENTELRKENNDLFSIRDMMVRDQELVCRENERLLKKLEDVNSVCCRSPIIPVRPSYSAELMSISYSGSRSGSAPDLSGDLSGDFPSGTSPVADIWTNPNHEMEEDLKPDMLSRSRSSGSLGESSTPPKATTPTRRPQATSTCTTPTRRPPHRLPDNINKELEKRNIGPSRGSLKNGKGGKSSGESEESPEEIFPAASRKKPGQLNDNIGSRRSNTNSASEDTNQKKANINNKKERAKKIRGQSK